MMFTVKKTVLFRRKRFVKYQINMRLESVRFLFCWGGESRHFPVTVRGIFRRNSTLRYFRASVMIPVYIFEFWKATERI